MKPHPTFTPEQVDALREIANFAAHRLRQSSRRPNLYLEGATDGVLAAARLLAAKFSVQNAVNNNKRKEIK